MLAIGIDLHRRRSDVVALNEAGEVILKRRMQSSREGFSRVFGELEAGSFEVVFEATYGWMWVGRFRGSEQLACGAGLTPRERSSAEHVRRGHISKQGSRWLRWVLVEASVRACKDQKLREFYEGIARRRGWKIARVALARRLLTSCYYALRDSDGSREYPASVKARS